MPERKRQEYAPRPITPRGVLRHGDWELKTYGIIYGPVEFDASRFEGGRRMALQALPAAAVAPGRAGVGFIIEHQGRDIDYLVLGWWDRDNELPLRVFVRDAADGEGWRAARGSESVCVWDLQVIWAEREAYVATVMGADADAGRARYLETVIRI